MHLRLKGTKYEPTEEMKGQVEEKVGGLARFLDESRAQAYAAVELERAVGGKRNGDVWRAELVIEHEGDTFRAESVKAKLDHALTTVVRDVARELSRAHKKRERMARRGSGILKAFLSRGE